MWSAGTIVAAVGLVVGLDALAWLPTSLEIRPNGRPSQDVVAFSIPFEVYNRSKVWGLDNVTLQCILDRAEYDRGNQAKGIAAKTVTIPVGRKMKVQFPCAFGGISFNNVSTPLFAQVVVIADYEIIWPWPNGVAEIFIWNQGEWLEGPLAVP